ncbi:MAG: DUF5615 family PIN-like protein [Bacteroidota bacterium]
MWKSRIKADQKEISYLIDENLSPELIEIFKKQGLNAYHVNHIKRHKNQRVKDDQLRRITLNKKVVIVTKDDDFVKSFVSRKVPEKLIFIFGMDKKKELLERMVFCVPMLRELMEKHDFVEINADEIKTPFS